MAPRVSSAPPTWERASTDPWRQARAFSARELVERVETAHVELGEFQHRVLTPLELDVIACPAAVDWRPGQLVSGLLRTFPDTHVRRGLGP